MSNETSAPNGDSKKIEKKGREIPVIETEPDEIPSVCDVIFFNIDTKDHVHVKPEEARALAVKEPDDPTQIPLKGNAVKEPKREDKKDKKARIVDEEETDKEDEKDNNESR